MNKSGLAIVYGHFSNRHNNYLLLWSYAGNKKKQSLEFMYTIIDDDLIFIISLY